MGQNYRDLIVWQKAIDLTVLIYSLAKKLPKEETYVLSDQMRRAAVSIPSNIAEGQERYHKNDFIRFLQIAQGSKSELETQLLICVKVGYLNENDIVEILKLTSEIGKMLNAFIEKLKSNPETGNR